MRVVAFALVAAVAANSQSATPIDRVVELIDGLRAKIVADGEAEQTVYDKYACWCEKTTARKAGAIEEAKTSIEELTQLILELKGKKATLTAEVKQLEKDIAANIQAQKEATEVRDKENAKFEEDKTENEQCLGALEQAIKVMTGAGTGKKGFLETMQEAQLLSIVGGVRDVMSKPNVMTKMSDAEIGRAHV